MPQDPAAPAHRPRLSTTGFLLLLAGISILIGLVDLAFGFGIRLSLLLLFLPAFVSGYGTVRQTLVSGAWSVAGLIVSFHFQPSSVRTASTLISVAVVLSALSVEAGRRRIRQEERVDRLRTTAGALQRQLLRSLPARGPSIRVHGLYQPLEEERLVGGDIYDVTDGPGDRTRILIADVQGKGLPAIGAGFAVLGAFRESALREEDLERVAATLEDAVLRHNEHAAREGEPERFVTALLLETDGGRTVRAVNCGHITPLLLSGRAAEAVGPAPGEGTGGGPAPDRPAPGEPRSTGPASVAPASVAPASVEPASVEPKLVEPLPEALSVPLGLQALSPEPRSAHTFALPTGSVLLLFTDGVTEARGPGGDFYPLEERLSTWSREGLPTDLLLERLRSDVEAYTRGRQRDDVTVLAVERTNAERAGAPAPGALFAEPGVPFPVALHRGMASGFR